MPAAVDDDESLLHLLALAGANATTIALNGTGDSAGAGSGACTTAAEDEVIERIAAIVAPVAFAIIGLTGLVGNALVVIVVLFNAQMRSTTNVLILNLAVSDLLFVCFCVPFTALDYVTVVWPFGDVWCKTVQYLIVVTANSSIYTLVLMSLDRYLAVVYPIASRTWRTERNTVRICVLMWLVILVASLPAWFAHGTVVSSERRMCVLCTFCERLCDPFAPSIHHSTHSRTTRSTTIGRQWRADFAITLASAFSMWPSSAVRTWCRCA